MLGDYHVEIFYFLNKMENQALLANRCFSMISMDIHKPYELLS